MTTNAAVPASAARKPRHWRWLRNVCIVIAGLAVLLAALGFFVVPRVARSSIEALARADLGREATLGKVEFNPFTLHMRLTGFKLADRDPSRTLLAFDALDIHASIESLWKLAPVIDALKLSAPKLDLVRDQDGHVNVEDLVERALAGPSGPTPKFSIDNIEIDNGAVTFDDELRQRTTKVAQLGIGIPFLSSFPHDATIRVLPTLEGTIDGSKFAMSGTATSPFADTEQATLHINLDAVRLAGYASYLTLPRGLKLADGALTTRLTLAFVTGPSGPRAVTLAGTATLDGLLIKRGDDSTLVAAKSIATDIAKIDVLAHTVDIARVDVESPIADLRRRTDGSLELASLTADNAATAHVTPRAPASGTPTAAARAALPVTQRVRPPAAAHAPSQPAWRVTVDRARVGGGTVHWTDASVSPAFDTTLSNVKLEGSALVTQKAGGDVAGSFDSDIGAHVDARAKLDLPHQSAKGHFAARKLALATLYPYYAHAVNLDLRRGTLDVAGDFELASGASPPKLMLTAGIATLTDVDAALRGQRGTLWSMKRADLSGIAVDTAQRRVAIDAITWNGGTLRLVRQSDGSIEFERLLSDRGSGPGSSPRVHDPAPAAPAGAAAGGPAWRVQVQHARVEHVAADIEDRVPQPAVRLRVTDERIAVDDFSTAAGARIGIDAFLRVGNAAKVRLAGHFRLQPAAADLRIDARNVDIVTFQPYFAQRTNVIVTSGSAAVNGRLELAVPEHGPLRASYLGNLAITDFDSLDRPESQQLLRWKSLALTGVDVRSEPLNVNLVAVTLDGFYARIILDANARLNLQQLLAPGKVAGDATAAGNAGSIVGDRRSAGSSGTTVAPVAAAPASRAELPIAIGHIRVANGEVEYSDFFVKPNYQTHLTHVEGSVSSMSPTQVGVIALIARVQDTAPVDIQGTINPFSPEFHLDLTAKATDVALPPLSPYAIKYAGYGIEKGKLSMQVHYKVDNRKLMASNKLRLDQLTFGNHVDSPTATRLPVLLAVSLLKDRNGVINLDLPIEGSLDDPQFSIWRVVVQIVVNLVTKAVTAPFALLESLAGGNGERLAWVEFAPGHATLSAAAKATLATLAKALDDRPGLKLDAAGRATPDSDRDGLKHARLERAMRTQKQKDLAAEGSSAPSIDEVTISAAEYPKYLAQVYRNTKLGAKPKNFLGIAKDVPPAEMKTLLLASYAVDDAALTALANQRAEMVKAWLVSEGKVDPRRVFVVAPKLGTQGIKDKGLATRVDFALR